MSISEYVKEEFKNLLRTRYEVFKENLNSDGFRPDSEEVWNMYSRAFNENNGVCMLAKAMLSIEQYDSSNGKLNELDVFLNEINAKYSDYCTAYVTGLSKVDKVEGVKGI